MSDKGDLTGIDAELKEAMQESETKSTLVKPFTMSHVLAITLKKAQRAVDTSIRITSERINEFDSDFDKSREIFNTLALLHDLRRLLDEFHKINAESFRKRRKRRSPKDGTTEFFTEENIQGD